jgi:hypothetical protein
MTDEKKAAIVVSHILKLLSEKIAEKPELIREIGLDISAIISSEKGNEMERGSLEFDSFTVYAEEGEAILRGKLEDLDLRSLKKLLKRHNFDPSQFAQKWKDKKRVIDLIVRRVSAQSENNRRIP